MATLAHVGGAELEPLQLAALAIAGLAYGRRARALAARGRPVPWRRAVAFAAGLAIAAAALASPLAHLGEELLAGHMAQHLLLGDLAALLLVAGLTGPIVGPVLALRPVAALRRLARPVPALGLWALNLYAWHLPAAYEAALASPPLHALQHLSFLGFGALLWATLLGHLRLPRPGWFGDLAAVGYVLAMRVATVPLAYALLFSGSLLYPAYAETEGAWGVDPLADQAAAGGIMLAESGAITLAALAWALARALRGAEQRRRLAEHAQARGVTLDSARARRAVAAGAEARLHRRIDQSSE